MIVIRTVSVGFCFAIALVCLGCNKEASDIDDSRPWRVQVVDKGALTKVDPSRLSEDLISKIKSDYAESPSKSGYTELELAVILENESAGTLYAFFDIRFVDDVQVVYEIGSDGGIVDRYVYSHWGTPTEGEW